MNDLSSTNSMKGQGKYHERDKSNNTAVQIAGSNGRTS
jgi:hypothetical protein